MTRSYQVIFKRCDVKELGTIELGPSDRRGDQLSCVDVLQSIKLTFVSIVVIVVDKGVVRSFVVLTKYAYSCSSSRHLQTQLLQLCPLWSAFIHATTLIPSSTHCCSPVIK